MWKSLARGTLASLSHFIVYWVHMRKSCNLFCVSTLFGFWLMVATSDLQRNSASRFEALALWRHFSVHHQCICQRYVLVLTLLLYFPMSTFSMWDCILEPDLDSSFPFYPIILLLTVYYQNRHRKVAGCYSSIWQTICQRPLRTSSN